MIRIDYDILFSIRGVLLDAGDEESGRIAPASWRFKPTEETSKQLKEWGMLFKQVGGFGLILAEPTRYEVGDEDEELAVFELAESLSFTMEVELDAPALVNNIDRGPGPRDGDTSFPADFQLFFSQAFPNSVATYVLDQDRLTTGQPPVGTADVVAPPLALLSFDKSRYREIVLQGPLPGGTVIPPEVLVDFAAGETVAVEDPAVVAYLPVKLPEGTYQLSGKKIQADNSTVDFSGEIFLNRGALRRLPLAFLDIKVSAGTITTGELAFVVAFRERAVAGTT